MSKSDGDPEARTPPATRTSRGLGWGPLVVACFLAAAPFLLRQQFNPGPAHVLRTSMVAKRLATFLALARHQGFSPASIDELVTRHELQDLGHPCLDPWGEPYAIQRNADGDGEEIVSRGPDRIAGTDDDIHEPAR